MLPAPSTRLPDDRLTRARRKQHAWIEYARRVERTLGGGQRSSETFGALPFVISANVATDGVVMRHGSTVIEYGGRDGALDGVPLLELATARRRSDDGKVRRRPVRIDVRESARDEPRTAGRARRILGGFHHRSDQRL